MQVEGLAGRDLVRRVVNTTARPGPMACSGRRKRPRRGSWSATTKAMSPARRAELTRRTSRCRPRAARPARGAGRQGDVGGWPVPRRRSQTGPSRRRGPGRRCRAARRRPPGRSTPGDASPPPAASDPSGRTPAAAACRPAPMRAPIASATAPRCRVDPGELRRAGSATNVREQRSSTGPSIGASGSIAAARRRRRSARRRDASSSDRLDAVSIEARRRDGRRATRARRSARPTTG